MTSIDSATMDAVHKLIEERQKFEGWLDGLQKRQASTAEHVFKRVFDDYSARLDAVTAQLSSHADQIRTALEQLTTTLTDIKNQESECIDERDEAELRAAVGEYSEEDWNSVRGTLDEQLEDLRAKRAKIEEEIAELQSIVETSQGGSSKPNATTQETVAAAAAVMNSTGPILSDNDDLEPVPSSSDIDEGWGEEESLAPPVSTHVDGASSVADSKEAAAPSLFANSIAPSAATAGDNRRESEKTLKCPECGALNYATEWYCERCGGELATF